MDSLPFEIITIIASYLPETRDFKFRRLFEDVMAAKQAKRPPPFAQPSIAAFASLSRRWQLAVEPLLFREIRVRSVELDEFAAIYSTSQSHRRRLLKYLRFEILLPTYNDAEYKLFESDQDRQANNKVSFEAIAALFNVLSGWGSDPAFAIDLSIRIYSPVDATMHNKYRADGALSGRSRDPDEPLVEGETDLFDDRYKYSYIRLPEPDTLPTLPCVRSMALVGDGRRFHPSSIVALAAKAPLAKTQMWWYTEPGVYLGLRREIRNHFAQALQTFRLSPSVETLDIDISGSIDSIGFFEGDTGHGLRLPNFVFPHRYDPLCSALHGVVGNNLKSLWYTGPTDPSLFWPYPEGEEPLEPFWSSLKELAVQFNSGSPCGRWYFRRPGYPAGGGSNVDPGDEPLPPDTVGHIPPGHGSEQDTLDALAYEQSIVEDWAWEGWGEFRTVPDDKVMLPLLEAFARAISQIPSLESADLTTELPFPDAEWSVSYLAPGVEVPNHLKRCIERDMALSTPRVLFQTGDWRPSRAVLGLFRNIGMKAYQQDAAIAFLSAPKDEDEDEVEGQFPSAVFNW